MTMICDRWWLVVTLYDEQYNSYPMMFQTLLVILEPWWHISALILYDDDDALMISIATVKNDEQRRGWADLWPAVVMNRVDWLMRSSVDEQMMWQWSALDSDMCVLSMLRQWAVIVKKGFLAFEVRIPQTLLSRVYENQAGSWMKSRCSLYQ